MGLIELLVEPLQYDFMIRALITAVASSAVCAVLSCWLILIGWSLMGDAVSHAVLPGVVLAYIVGVPYSIGAAASGFIAVALIGALRSTSGLKEDAAIGAVFSTFFALGLVLISVTPSQIDLNHIIFGSLLGVSDTDLIQVLTLSGAVLIVLLAMRRNFTLFAFDPGHAHTIGLNPRLLAATLLGLLALTSVVALQAVGVVLVVALLIIPGATAFMLTTSIQRMLLIAPATAVFSALAGVYLSYYLDTSTGPTVVLMNASVLLLTYAAVQINRLTRSRRGSPQFRQG